MQQSLFCTIGAGKGHGMAAAPSSEQLPCFGARLEGFEHIPHPLFGQDTGVASQSWSLQSPDVSQEQCSPPAGSGAQVPQTLLLLLPGNSLSQAIFNVQLPTERDTGEDFGA